MILISEDKLYDLLRIENLWNLAQDWIPDEFFDQLEDYFKKEEACTINKLMREYETYRRD